MMSTALIVVDMQAGFLVGESATPTADQLTRVIEDLVDRAHAAGALVVQLQNDGAPGAVDEPGTPGWQLRLPVADDDVVIRKHDDDGFVGTTLQARLAAAKVNRVIICGLMSEMCVAATARGAIQRGYAVSLPHDAHGTYDIPAAEGISDAVPAPMVSRVAEWSLGDEVHIVPHAADVDFTS